MQDPIVVTGIALNAPFGRTKEDLWSFLARDVRAPKPVDRFPVDGCRVKTAYLHWPAQDTATLYDGTVATARAALQDAGLEPGRRIGFALGSISVADAGEDDTARRDGAVNGLGQHCIGRLGLSGPLVHVMSACTSSAAALFWAKLVLENDDADAMLVGGADRIRAVDFAGFNILRAMDPERSRPFHGRRQGITMGEGACFLVLERLSRATARDTEILAVFAGAGLSCDAHHATAPRCDGLVAAGRQALHSAGLAPSDIGYVNCHGTGTVANDAEESKALRLLFGPHLGSIVAGSTKGFTGHWLGSAGALEAAISIMALRADHAPSMPWLDAGEGILEARQAADPDGPGLRHVMSNSLGFGGNNVSLIFSQPQPETLRRASR